VSASFGDGKSIFMPGGEAYGGLILAWVDISFYPRYPDAEYGLLVTNVILTTYASLNLLLFP